MIDWKDASQGDKLRFKIVQLVMFKHKNLIDFLFKTDVPEMIADEMEVISRAGCFSSGEQILIKMACTIWFSSPAANVFDVCRRLDEENFEACIRAMRLFRKL